MVPNHDNDEHLFDEIDMKRTYSAGFWWGAIAGTASTIILLAIVGLYYSNWQLP